MQSYILAKFNKSCPEYVNISGEKLLELSKQYGCLFEVTLQNIVGFVTVLFFLHLKMNFSPKISASLKLFWSEESMLQSKA